MSGPAVYVVCAEGEESVAEQLAVPLRQAGYSVAHSGTVLVGASHLNEATKALSSGAPIVLCATARAIGSRWGHQIVNAGRKTNNVYVVQMEADAYIDQMALNTRVAKYYDDPVRAINDLLQALRLEFPVQGYPTEPKDLSASMATPLREYLDQPVPTALLDIEALNRFRSELRPEIIERCPSALTAWEFLDRANLRVGDVLNRTGALLFAENPSAVCPTAMIKCVRYAGTTKDSVREELVTYEGTVPAQITAARMFVARHVQRGEAPTSSGARAEPVYEYPMIAVREIVANALAHRDYSSQRTCVHLRLYSDRLEVSSPGTWVGRELESQFEHNLADLNGQSIKRNFRLAHLLSWIFLVEGEGSGIPTAVQDCDSSHAPRPTVVQDQGFVIVTLYPNPTDDAELIHKYRQSLITAHGSIATMDLHQYRRVPLEELYVSPQILPKSSDPDGSRVTLDQFRATARRAVILGDPGGGKTTTALAIATRAARDDHGLLPFFLTARDILKDGQQSPSILDHIQSLLRDSYLAQLPRGLVERYLHSGDAIVIFDGLDELIDPARRREIIQVVESFAAQYARVRILVTSRRSGYAEMPLDSEMFDIYTLAEFSESDVAEFAAKWFKYYEPEAGWAAKMTAAFVGESRIAPDLRRSPLMLSLMCSLYRGIGFLPRNRPQIYEGCASLMFERWDAARGIGRPSMAGTQANRVISHLAYWMLTNQGESTMGTPRSAVVREVTEYMYPRRFEDAKEARTAAEEFVDFCRGRAWVFTDVGVNADGESLYDFSHRSFKEYFAAYQIVRQSASVEAVAQTLLPKVSNGEWETVSQLAIQIANDVVEDGADRIVAAMLDSAYYRSEEYHVAVLRFLTRCIEVAQIDSALARRVMQPLLTTTQASSES